MGASARLKSNPRTGAFWGELAPDEHAVQIYRDEVGFMDCLEGFIGSGLRAGDSVIVIAMAANLHEIEKRLRGSWIDLDRARWEDRYIAVLPQETLAKFMVDAMPDEFRFQRTARELLTRARGQGRRVRVFSEMVAVLWAQGNCDAAIRLEQCWTRLQAAEQFPLFCAYPRAQFKTDAEASIQTVCSAHSRVIPGYV
jgi:hypothetical protein